MTREEYEKLLKSDYWRGFSYSLIKERDFTCEDCGRRFYNERNKLQVHHLVYRDVAPWSYKPEELVVLCEDCHKKRHGIMSDSDKSSSSTQSSFDTGSYSKSYSYNSDFKAERSHSFDAHSTENRDTQTTSSSDDISSRNPWPEEKENRFKLKYALYGLLALCVLYLGYYKLHDYKEANVLDNTEEKTIQEANENESEAPNVFQETEHIDKSAQTKGGNLSEKRNESSVTVPSSEATQPLTGTSQADTHLDQSAKNSSSDVQPSEVVRRNQNDNSDAGLSTSEILDRRTHANVVEQAKRAGVSTEGTTSEILDRITHANVVKQAKRAGVSTEGTTSEILDRITHANVVKQAKRAGVSTEGTTSEILERITRKNLESR